jgi:pentatricopeptide repeat protein
MLIEARAVFDKLIFHDVITWTAIISGYADDGQSDKALECFKHMQDDGIPPTDVTYVCAVKACGSIVKGQELHSEVCKKGHQENSYVGSALVDMYAKWGSLTDARVVFDKLQSRNVVSWNALISGIVEQGHNEEVLNLLAQMPDEAVSPDIVTLVCGLKACANIRAREKGMEMYSNTMRKGLERNIVVGNTLIAMFSKCGCLTEARDVFNKLPDRNAVSWTALISGYAEYGYAEEVQHMLNQMQREGVCPNSATFVCSTKLLKNTDKGQGAHSEIVKLGLEKEALVGNTVVDMYAKFGLISEAQHVFEGLLTRDVVSWNAMMSGLVEHGFLDESLNCLDKMMNVNGISPDAISFASGLQACGSKGAIDKGRDIHAWIIKLSLCEMDDAFGSTLVDMYGKCGLLEEAQNVFDRLPIHSKGSWNAIMAAYAECGYKEKAMECYDHMEIEGESPDSITIVCALKACSDLCAAVRGQQMHSEAMRKGLDVDPLVGNTLVFMYAKCSLIGAAQKVFERLSDKNIVSWTALISGYAQVGKSENVFSIFDEMVEEGVKPDAVTLGSVLSACSHSGVVDKARTYFDAMVRDHGLAPTPEHYICMIDLLGRAGHIDDAIGMIRRMPYQPGIIVWHIILGACRKWGKVAAARHSFEEALRLDEDDISAYLCMFNIYQDAGMHEDARRVEAMRKAKDV